MAPEGTEGNNPQGTSGFKSKENDTDRELLHPEEVRDTAGNHLGWATEVPDPDDALSQSEK